MRRHSRTPRRTLVEDKGGDRGKGKGEKKQKGKGKGGGKDSGPLADEQKAYRAALEAAKLEENLQYYELKSGKRNGPFVRYNRGDSCQGCYFAHVCLRCLGPDKLKDCTAPPRRK